MEKLSHNDIARMFCTDVLFASLRFQRPSTSFCRTMQLRVKAIGVRGRVGISQKEKKNNSKKGTRYYHQNELNRKNIHKVGTLQRFAGEFTGEK